MEKYFELLSIYGRKLVLAIILYVLGKYIIKFLLKMLKKTLKKAKFDESLKSFLDSFLSLAFNFILIIIVVSTLGVETSSLVALLGAAGLAVGLALQGSLSNFASGVLILLFRPFNVGDFIEAEGFSGTVKDIQIFSTHIDTIDNKRIIIPNSILSNGIIINYTKNKERQLDLIFSIAYEANIDKAKYIIKQVLEQNNYILKDKNILIGILKHSASSIDIRTRAWVKTEKYWDVYYYLMEKIKIEFDRNGIEIPYQKIDINLKK
ncbi:small conductance mechanosensitive channel [Hypnocyclicus thermotrophus]|uniref:Small conductance mechanosensitive channel n=1 Tax=Hypnocyclicus thermotrophus TaxID=1627895 RepID=A0AA46I681_9FUSO|nr:mechanosensitive ion channel domain-containing protein [Hypnocyclicus thermotrophus]TDT72264.1 small conductance mechanosensitive channel [Hypnocyclicus thermotrophus]